MALIDKIEDLLKEMDMELGKEDHKKYPYVVVRTAYAGVHAGYMVSNDRGYVKLINSRRLWSWKGALTLSELSTKGVENPKECKFACPVTIELTSTEIISTTKEAEKSINGVPEWKN